MARSGYPAALPLLARHVTANSLGLVESVALALVRSGDGPMLELLTGVLRDREQSHMKRACIARAMGGTTHAGAQEALREVIDQEVASVSDEEYPALLVEAVVALAKCGDQGRSPVLLDIIRSGQSTAGSLALHGLKVALPAGMAACIRDAAADPYLEIQRAVEALYLLGNRAGCALLLQMAESDDFDVALNSLVSAGNIVGTPVMDLDELPDVQDAWLALRSDMRDDVCYRSGEPLDPRKLYDGLVNATTPGGRDQYANEIEIRSGLDVRGAILFGDEQRLSASLDRMSMRPGATYRWGHLHPAPGTG